MDDRSIAPIRPFDRLRAGWSVVRACESSRHQRQLLAQAYQQVFAQIRQPLGNVGVAATRCSLPHSHRTAARVAAGA